MLYSASLHVYLGTASFGYSIVINSVYIHVSYTYMYTCHVSVTCYSYSTYIHFLLEVLHFHPCSSPPPPPVEVNSSLLRHPPACMASH